MIEVEGLKKRYDAKEALKGISFHVSPGEFFGFLGPNGAGKTTTIRILTGQLSSTEGTARILNKDVLKESREIQPHMGIVPEQTNLYERLTVGQNLAFFCKLYGAGLERVDEYLARVNLAGEKNTQIKKLSKGMKQRVLLVRALLHQPEILFLDEPTSGLDPVSADSIHELLRALNRKGMTVFLTSHNMEEVDKLCHRVAFLDNGLIVETGKPSELKLKYTNGDMKVLLTGHAGDEERVIKLRGDESAGQMAVWMAEGRVQAVHSCEPTLGDIFMRVTGREFV